MKLLNARISARGSPVVTSRRPVLGLALYLLLLLGCGTEGDWHRETLRPATDSVRALAADDGQASESAAGRKPSVIAQLLPPTEIAEAAVSNNRPAKPAGVAAPKPGVAQAPVLPSVLPPSRKRTIDLETALRQAGAANPTIALAREAVQASLAEQLRAQAMLLPTLHAGASFNLHRGVLQTSRGEILEVNRQSLYMGAGAAAVGAGTVTIPGISLAAQLTEAWYEPKAARGRVAGRQFDALATRNNILLEVTSRYLALAGAAARLQILGQSEQEMREVVRMTGAFAVAGQGRQGDADRALSELLLLHAVEERAQEDIAVAAAELARLLDFDPSVRLEAPEGPVPLLRLVDAHEELEKLVQIALRNRPEIGARSADIAVKTTLLREEQVRPFLPDVAFGFSAGDFGGGSDLADTRFGHVSSRLDCDVMAVWSLENFGLGNVAVQRRRRAQVVEAEAVRARVIDQIRREVALAQAQARARRQQLDVARRRVAMAEEAYHLDLLRTRNLKGYPIELLNSLRLLTRARQSFVGAIIEFDQAQFQLFVALGEAPIVIEFNKPGLAS